VKPLASLPVRTIESNGNAVDPFLTCWQSPFMANKKSNAIKVI